MRIVISVILGACGFSRELNEIAIDAPADASSDAPSDVRPQALACPTGYINVPANAEFATKEFCIAKYEMKNMGNVPTSQAALVPWGTITRDAAKAACVSLGAGYHLVTNTEWMAIARAIEANPDNWSTTPTKFLSKGKTDNCGSCVTYSSYCPGPAMDSDPCYETVMTGCTNRGAPAFRFNRTHEIGDAVIWDFSGNSFELVDHPITTNPTRGGNFGESINGVPGTTFVPPLQEKAYKSANTAHTDVATAGSPANPPQPVGANNVGILYVTDQAAAPNVTRGGDFCGFAGIYSVALLRDSELGVNIGFRCAYTPP